MGNCCGLRAGSAILSFLSRLTPARRSSSVMWEAGPYVQVGKKFGVTRERVRQIQNLALRKLRKMIEKFESTKTKNN